MGGVELLQDVVEREVLAEHPGMSGAGLERVRLADGRRLVVKEREAADLGWWVGRARTALEQGVVTWS